MQIYAHCPITHCKCMPFHFILKTQKCRLHFMYANSSHSFQLLFIIFSHLINSSQRNLLWKLCHIFQCKYIPFHLESLKVLYVSKTFTLSSAFIHDFQSRQSYVETLPYISISVQTMQFHSAYSISFLANT